MLSSSLLKPSIVACCFLGLLLLLPVKMSSASCRQDSTTTTILSKIGEKLLEYTVEEGFPSQLYTNVTIELNEISFQEKVCSYFEHYHRFYWSLRYIMSQNNSTEHESNTALLTLLLKKSTKSMCFQFKNACADRDICSNLDCNINSIATLCLGLPTQTQLVNFLQPPVQLPTNTQPMLVQLWMQLNLSTNDLSNGVFEALARILEETVFIRCTVPDSGTVNQITCSYIL